MIPFASQRGGGQDLATHLMNAHDNEQVTLFDLRGAVARDLHGALAEWEAIAGALTRCRQYLCSLSINPDERQGRLTRDQYLDYIARTESALGLAGQPRAIIFHVKRDGHGRAREHCHVVWSRIVVEKKRAVPLSFFKEKMMAVTRAFARDHGLALPPGYDRQEDAQRRNRQLSPYDCTKHKQTGISHEERMAAVTDAWRRSDSARAFVNALADLGYILAQGRNGTRVVLVDFYGHTTALTRLIDDPAVRAKHVREFLGPDYAPDNLPTAEQAQAIAAQRRKLIEAFEAARAETDQTEALVGQQRERRQALEGKAAALRQRQHEERIQLVAAQKAARHEQQSAYLAEQKRIRLERAQRKPKGLAAFLGRVTGIALITRKMQRYRDRKRYGAYIGLRAALKKIQRDERDALARGHELQAADKRRRLRALDQVERRERQTLETAALTARRQAINARHVHMPSLASALIGLGDMSERGTDGPRRGTLLVQEFARVVGQPEPEATVRLAQAFERASGGGEDESGDAGGTETPAPAEDVKIQRRRDRRRRRKAVMTAFTRAVDDSHADGDGGDNRSGGPKPAEKPTVTQRRRKRRVRKKRDREGALLSAFNDAAGGGDDDSGKGGSADVPAPAAEAKIRRRQRRRRKRDLDREFNSVSGAGDGRSGDGDSGGGPRRNRRSRGPDPPESGGPPRPLRTRRRDLDRGR
jgi:hypothetical protein